MICIDNSDHMRNGDYPPDRFRAQMDAVVLLVEAKLSAHPQSSIGLIQSSGKGSKILSTPCDDAGKITSSLHEVKIGGTSDLLGSIRVAQLALKHRSNKNGGQRIVLFVGSPVAADTETLVGLAGRLKKSNISVDVVNFGEYEENTEKLKSFVDAVNNEGQSRLVTAERGPALLSDAIISSPLMFGGSGGSSSSGAMETADPELAEAIRLSLAASGANTEGAPGVVGDDEMDPDLLAALKMSVQDAKAESSVTAVEEKSGESGPSDEPLGDDEMDPDLLAAIKMSMQDGSTPSPSEDKTDKVDDETDDEAMLEQAKALSMQSSKTDTKGEDELKQALLKDPSFVNDLFSGLPGVDASNPKIRDALSGMTSKEDKEEKDKKK